MDGVIALRDINVGDLASDAAAGKPIFRIVDNRVLNLTVTVPSADSARVKVGQPLEFSVDALPGRFFSGKVMFINPELNAADRSLKVVAEVQNQSDLLKGGLFAKGRIVTGTRPAVLQVPRSVLGSYDTTRQTAILFVAEGQTVRQRTLKTGIVNGELVEIREGMKAGEQYVSRGGFTLRDGDRIAVQGAAEKTP
jgi:RND family efflux transporter MFP subunit